MLLGEGSPVKVKRTGLLSIFIFYSARKVFGLISVAAREGGKGGGGQHIKRKNT